MRIVSVHTSDNMLYVEFHADKEQEAAFVNISIRSDLASQAKDLAAIFKSLPKGGYVFDINARTTGSFR